mgnify:CR=1 FL=1
MGLRAFNKSRAARIRFSGCAEECRPEGRREVSSNEHFAGTAVGETPCPPTVITALRVCHRERIDELIAAGNARLKTITCYR